MNETGAKKKDLVAKSRSRVFEIIDTLSGVETPRDAMLVMTSGRYEFHNKGIDLFIKALGELNKDVKLKKYCCGHCSARKHRWSVERPDASS